MSVVIVVVLLLCSVWMSIFINFYLLLQYNNNIAGSSWPVLALLICWSLEGMLPYAHCYHQYLLLMMFNAQEAFWVLSVPALTPNIPPWDWSQSYIIKYGRWDWVHSQLLYVIDRVFVAYNVKRRCAILVARHINYVYWYCCILREIARWLPQNTFNTNSLGIIGKILIVSLQ